LARDSNPSAFMESPALSEDFRLTDVDKYAAAGAAEYEPGHRIDKYVIREPLGEGGAAVVYLAEQEEPVRRLVALKIIKPGMDSRQVIARFEAERQALAMMDHACVAKVFDAGSTETGRPYFIMEHVPGIAITEHCDRQRLSIEDRLKLFMQVCEAVQHAHQKGIIHRDLKPGNVLVLVKDGQAIPKVIDFGVAKAVHQRLTERTIFTEQGRLIGTPAYMSPEQAEMGGEDIDTRSDIYSLGVLLYELLTGALPFDLKTLRQSAFGEVQRIIREDDPPKPSTRISGNGEDLTAHAAECRVDPRSLARELRGDLDWIVMKAMEKDRTRRYETASELAMDIRRHLEHEPVQARPPSRAYRLRKFVRRNRAGVAAGAVAAISLIAATVVSVSFAVSEAEQRRIASAEATRADEEREIAQAVNEFLNNDLLAAVAPSAEQGRGRDVLMREVLDEASRRIEEAAGEGGRFEDKPLVEAAIRETIGVTYVKLGEFRAAEPHLKRARVLRQRELGGEHPATLRSMWNLASLYRQQGRYDEAEPLYLQTLEVRRRVLGEEHPDTLASMNSIAALYFESGRWYESAPLWDQVLEIKKRVLGEEHRDTLMTMYNLAHLLPGDEAVRLWRQTLEIQRRVLGEEDPDTVTTMGSLAMACAGVGRHDEAESLYLETLEIQRRVLGRDNMYTLGTTTNLGLFYKGQGRLDEAEELLVESVEAKRRVLGMRHPWTRLAFDGLATVYELQGRKQQALPLRRELLEDVLAAAREPGADARAKNEGASVLLTTEHAELFDPVTALGLAIEANDMTDHREPMFLDTLALAYHLTGDTAAAIETEKKALSLAPANAPDRAEYEARLAEFEAALASQADQDVVTEPDDQ
ncbi:MAG: serine/threonine protein kinase, partial [Phycisphaerales bacterium]